MLALLPAPSPLLFWFFVALPLLVSGSVIWGVTRTSGPVTGRSAARITGAWLLLTGALAVSGLLDHWSPPRMPLLLLVVLAFLVWAARQPWTERLGDLPLQVLVGFQGFRVLVEFGLHAAVNQGIAHPTMTWTGTNADIIPGITALALFPFAHRIDRRVLMAWNVIMAGVLVVTVATAMLAAPTPLRLILGDPANVFIARFPFVWIPLVLVTSAWLGHVVLFRRLRRS